MEPAPNQQLADLLAKMDALAARVARIEAQLGAPGGSAAATAAAMPHTKAAPPPMPPPVPGVSADAPVGSAAPPMAFTNASAGERSTGVAAPPPPLMDSLRPHETIAKPAPIAPPARREDLESTMGLTWVNRIGALTLILAVGFVFKYAADNNWITPGMRIALGVLAGLSFCGGAEMLLRKGHRVVAQGISGVGVATIYFSLYVGYEWFGLLPQLLAFGAMAATSLGAGALALRYQSQGFAILAALGGFLTPLLVGGRDPSVWLLNVYVLLLAGSGVWVALHRGWKVLAWILYLGAKALFWISVLEDSGDTPGYPGVVIGAALYALFLQTRQTGLISLAQASFALAILTATGFKGKPVWTWEIVLPAVIGVAVAQWRNRAETAFSAMVPAHGLLLLATAMMADGSDYLTIPANGLGAGLLVGVWALFSWFIVWRWLGEASSREGVASGLFAVNSLLFAAELRMLFEGAGWPAIGAVLTLLAAVHLGASLLPEALPFAGYSTLRSTSQVVGVALLAVAVPLHFEGEAVTVLWAVLAAAVAWASKARRAPWMDAASVLLFAAALVRYLFDDLPNVTASSRVFLESGLFTGSVTGAALFVAAYAWRGQAHAWLAYFAGHFSLLVALLHEVWVIAGRTASPGDLLVARTAGISVTLAVYGAVMVMLGVMAKSRANRLAGLAILLFVAVKLYLFDVWLLGTLARIVAFGALGTMLLLTSFLYSKLKSTVRDFLSAEEEPPAGSGVAS